MMGTMLDYDRASGYLSRGQWGESVPGQQLRDGETLELGAVEHGLKWFIRQALDRLSHGIEFLEYGRILDIFGRLAHRRIL